MFIYVGSVVQPAILSVNYGRKDFRDLVIERYFPNKDKLCSFTNAHAVMEKVANRFNYIEPKKERDIEQFTLPDGSTIEIDVEEVTKMSQYYIYPSLVGKLDAPLSQLVMNAIKKADVNYHNQR